MRQIMLTQSGAPGYVIGWTNFSHLHSVHGFRRNFNVLLDLSSNIYLLVLVGVELSLSVVVTPS